MPATKHYSIAKAIYWDEIEGMHCIAKTDTLVWAAGGKLTALIFEDPDTGEQLHYFGQPVNNATNEGLCGPNECTWRLDQLIDSGALIYLN